MRDKTEIQKADWKQHRDLLLAVRYEVFVREQGIPATIEVDAEDEIATHYLAVDSHSTPIGTARMLPQGKIGRVAVVKEHRREGVGTRLILALIEEARDKGLKSVALHAQRTSILFYEQLGFVARGEEFYEVGIPHFKMELPL